MIRVGQSYVRLHIQQEIDVRKKCVIASQFLISWVLRNSAVHAGFVALYQADLSHGKDER